ncbi:GNAT family N-acetyltransferase [uncultured Croceicoccus sp.]|uniref:GNAT family N-acetyltransferase n=1 Tax=uncultured Croceicoccus sp. TaxID=1295329 RepID=UPI00262CE787|nr:GNAT family N-acetyltransferase [uncultured Croceicoccus sp.]
MKSQVRGGAVSDGSAPAGTRAFALRPAVMDDAADLRILIRRCVDKLLPDVLTPEQVRSSHRFMSLDTQLIEDGTYFVAVDGGTIIGCGGWSFRATHYGGDGSTGRDARRLCPKSEPARIRAMYTSPAHTRRGVARAILHASESAARAHGFASTTLGATLGGEALYRLCGYTEIRRFHDGDVPIIEMTKSLS